MPRQSRKKSRSGIYHVMLRGINKQTIFEDDEDKGRFVWTILKYQKKCDYEIYGYCLMDNHVHLLLKEKDDTLSEIIKKISSSYVYWYNTKYDRCGHLFQARFRSEIVETTTCFLRVLRYIHQNPLKAGLAKDIFSSKWTSIHEYFSPSSPLNTDVALQLFSENKDVSFLLFKDYMNKTNKDQYLDDLPRIRKTDEELKGYFREMGINHISMLQQMDKPQRNAILVELKKIEGVSGRQLSRITGISKSVLQRLK
ncbi:transposase [Bacillus sp. AFS015802]|uniref:transposase n=1 Tax=Bacillus sp. AFS015802 TaxID=2033486 RepID=UPI000BF96501|nr:transposase [Bacillus sp. AFS015802]PFA66795.1 transposase [Bacillus sp. AFS015802]